MKVLAINSSPNMEKGNTALILTPFLKGMTEAGADVELFYTKNLHINPCQADISCYTKTPGHCFQDDDMQILYPKLGADVIVLASPNYIYGINGPMKNIIDRMVAIGEPYIILREGHCRHRIRDSVRVKDGKLVLVSTCGFWEMDNFDLMVAYMKALSSAFDREYTGALLRPHSSVLRGMLRTGAPVNDILEAAETAGHELVRDGRMSEKNLRTISRELVPLETFVQSINSFFKPLLESEPKTP